METSLILAALAAYCDAADLMLLMMHVHFIQMRRCHALSRARRLYHHIIIISIMMPSLDALYALGKGRSRSRAALSLLRVQCQAGGKLDLPLVGQVMVTVRPAVSTSSLDWRIEFMQFTTRLIITVCHHAATSRNIRTWRRVLVLVPSCQGAEWMTAPAGGYDINAIY